MGVVSKPYTMMQMNSNIKNNTGFVISFVVINFSKLFCAMSPHTGDALAKTLTSITTSNSLRGVFKVSFIEWNQCSLKKKKTKLNTQASKMER